MKKWTSEIDISINIRAQPKNRRQVICSPVSYLQREQALVILKNIWERG